MCLHHGSAVDAAAALPGPDDEGADDGQAAAEEAELGAGAEAGPSGGLAAHLFGDMNMCFATLRLCGNID